MSNVKFNHLSACFLDRVVIVDFFMRQILVNMINATTVIYTSYKRRTGYFLFLSFSFASVVSVKYSYIYISQNQCRHRTCQITLICICMVPTHKRVEVRVKPLRLHDIIKQIWYLSSTVLLKQCSATQAYPQQLVDFIP